VLDHVQISEEDIDAYLANHDDTLPEQKKPLEFDAIRRAALIGWDDLQACPGSGKTTLIATKLMILARKWRSKYQGICVLTHTNVACDEIRSRLELDADGYKLLSYPHFIGTIQEFIDRYIGLPLTRSLGFDLRLLSSDEFESEFDKIRWGKFLDRNTAKQYWFNYYLIRKKILPTAFSLTYSDDGLVVNPVFKQSFERVINFDKGGSIDDFLLKKKRQYLAKGLALYRDMYAFATFLLGKNNNLLISLRTRFPKVLVDEMQDTQKFQDELINSIFECDNVKIQRFGDPDQAIFDNMGGEEVNNTFNENDGLTILAHSHRFSVDIAKKVSNLSYSQIGEIQALAEPDDPHEHTVIVYDDDSRQQVLNVFAEIVAEHDADSHWSIIKAVGATEGQGKYISAYWGGFDRRKSIKSPRPERLFDIVCRKWWQHEEGAAKQYKLVVQGILDLLRIANVMDARSTPQRYFNINTLKSWLRDNEHYSEFRELITEWILDEQPTINQWNGQIDKLKGMLGIADSDEITNYLEHNNAIEDNEVEQATGNVFNSSNGRSIEVGTIHSVKGETHDATLVLETKNHQYDIEQLLNQIAGIDIEKKITGKRKIKFARQLYVAVSRPRHLLCLAIHNDHISEVHTCALRDEGWHILDLTCKKHKSKSVHNENIGKGAVIQNSKFSYNPRKET